MKLFPRNLTARADYVVRGNPVVSRPESGADNSHPGLEFDMRNLDRGFFPGLLFDFQFGIGARLADIQPPWLGTEKDGKNRLAADDGELFLWYVYGIFGDQPDRLTLADLYGIDGYDVLRKIHDLEPGPLVVVVGRHPDELKVGNPQTLIAAASRLWQMAQPPEPAKPGTPVEPGQPLETFRDGDGNLLFAVLTGKRADYLNGDGVIELQTAEPGALTRSLCSPWQWDFADCGCYYWAASRPDIVTSKDGKQEQLNFLRDREGVSPPGDLRLWDEWMKNERIMSQPQMIQGWEALPLVINDKEAESYAPPEQSEKAKQKEIDGAWNRVTVVGQLKHLAAVEHTLCVKFLYAHYSVKAPQEADGSDLFKVANAVFKIAIDEMRHFRWVNEALVMLDEQPVFSRASRLSDLPGGAAIRQHQAQLRLEGLTPEALKRFIEIEKPSQDYGPEEIAGLYTHILVSLDRHADRYTEYKDDVRER